MKILFVCTGNICRSPMAEYMLRDMIGDKAEAASAGVYAETGMGATANALTVLKEIGIDASAHRARQLTKDMLEDYDYIYTMTKSHKNIIEMQYKNYPSKLFSIAEFAGCNDIDDPYYGDVDTYRNTRVLLKPALEKIVKRLEL